LTYLFNVLILRETSQSYPLFTRGLDSESSDTGIVLSCCSLLVILDALASVCECKHSSGEKVVERQLPGSGDYKYLF
jgi:hypothetical protein